ncbi:hypothetical protein DdX_15913 [Ditylenchus destructor]|uniref:F-box domain-containing protein n=1 Tax=Ditylenchus destructor TaxID=166010 RepID=A0AAD4R0C6_9BILA|nr:hypothetical protein DdX_15913 [Ditylenchus destructor]
MNQLSLESIPREITLKILSHLNRRDLMRFSSTTKSFNHLIECEFSTKPILLLGSLHYNYGRWRCATKWPRTLTITMTSEMVKLVKKWKFLRFPESEFAFGSHPDPYGLLRSVSHVWEDRYLCIHAEKLGPTEELARLVTSSGAADLIVNGIFKFLQQLVSGKCNEILFHDRLYDPTDEPRMVDIVNFLFRPIHNFSPNSLTIHTNYPLSRENCDKITEAAKEKFLSATVPLAFYFKWTFNGGSYPEAINSVTNQYICQILRISTNSNRFSMTLKNK